MSQTNLVACYLFLWGHLSYNLLIICKEKIEIKYEGKGKTRKKTKRKK